MTTPPPVVNVVPGTMLLRESFGPGSTGYRPTGGNGTLKQGFIAQDLSGFWAEYPGNNTETWTAPGGRQAHTWTLSASSVNPKEAPSPMDFPGLSNGTVSLTGGTAGLFDNPVALLPFQAPAITYEVSIDMAIEPNQVGDWLGVGFTSSNALNHNLETAGQAWMLFKMDNPLVDSFHGSAELHTNGMSGQSVSVPVIRLNFDTMTVRYDPVAKLVSGYFNGTLIGTIPYNAGSTKFVAFEGASAVNDTMTVDNFIVKASN